MKKLIYSKEDLDLILCLETEKYEDKINNLQSKIDKVVEFIDNYEIKENIDHDIYMTLLEIKDILKEGENR